MKKRALTLVTTTALSTFAVSALASDIRTALTEGDVDLSLRYRLEHVEQDGTLASGATAPEKDALASTLKTRITYKSKPVADTQLTLEFDDVHVVGEQRYRDGEDRPNIADPEGSELNQASLTYTGLSDTTLILGKQRIVLGNQRFVGGVAWRQHEQTYNAFTLANKSIPDTTVIYSNVKKVNHFIHTNDDINTDAHIVYVENQSIPDHKITGYAFLLDLIDVEEGAASTQTVGARFEGGIAGLGYALEYAQQSDYSRPSGDSGFNADYNLVEVSYKFEPVKLIAAMEILGSDDGNIGFSTPLATKHKFNGWADMFLGTPPDGLEDTYIGAIANIAGTKVKVFYHEYEANEGSSTYGDEINIAVAKKFGKVNGLLKFADYSADEHGFDTQKVWLQVATKF